MGKYDDLNNRLQERDRQRTIARENKKKELDKRIAELQEEIKNKEIFEDWEELKKVYRKTDDYWKNQCLGNITYENDNIYIYESGFYIRFRHENKMREKDSYELIPYRDQETKEYQYKLRNMPENKDTLRYKKAHVKVLETIVLEYPRIQEYFLDAIYRELENS